MFKNFFIQTYYCIVYYIPCLFRELYLRLNGTELVPIISFLNMKWGQWKHQNWGDDMNVYFMEHFAHKRVINFYTSLISKFLVRTNYALIGSILHDANKRTIVWGSGLISDKTLPQERPQKFCAVRGPLTRKVLINHGFSCPAIYGDPILLLPFFYKPNNIKKYSIGIVPHINDEDNLVISTIKKNVPDSIVISMSKYNDWHDIIDQINSCDCILSSSLHGIILADAYKIKNIWIEFSGNVYGNGFKFYDYFASVGREMTAPLKIENLVDFNKAIMKVKEWKPISIDLTPLIRSCPFDLNLHQKVYELS